MNARNNDTSDDGTCRMGTILVDNSFIDYRIHMHLQHARVYLLSGDDWSNIEDI